MARGVPHVWGAGLGIPTFLGGAYVVATGGTETAPAGLGYPFVILGAVALLLGVYVSRVSPEPPEVEPIEVFKPSQLSAYLLGVASLPVFVVTLYFLFWTRIPYVWPTLSFVLFVILFVKGLVRYWQNSLTTYYVTEDRVISEYRFIGMKRNSANITEIGNIDRHQSPVETLTGLGNVTVRSPSADIRFSDLARPAEAERILTALSPLRSSD
jgi:membrane protein YdbS with pleckstrin-like domain